MVKKAERKALLIRITSLLHRIGTPAHIKGHNYLRSAIIRVYMDESYLGNMMSRLYPDLAEEYNTSLSCVERGIRNAVELSWNRGDVDVLNEIFGNTISYSRSKPTNSEFIAMISDLLRVEDYK